MLSAFFLARTFKKESIINGKSFYVPIFMDNENYHLEIKYLANEIIDTKWGKIDCMVFGDNKVFGSNVLEEEFNSLEEYLKSKESKEIRKK